MKSFNQYYNEGLTVEPEGGWDVKGKPLDSQWFEDRYQEINNNWVPIKRTVLTGEVVDFTVFEGMPGERKMELRDISITSRKERKAGVPLTLTDWVMSNIKEVIIWTSNWINADEETNDRIVFRPPVDKDDYQAEMSELRKQLVGFGNNPDTLFHRLSIQNAKTMVPFIESVINNMFDISREVQHYLVRQGDPPKDPPPLPGTPPPQQSPEDDPNQGPY